MQPPCWPRQKPDKFQSEFELQVMRPGNRVVQEPAEFAQKSNSSHKLRRLHVAQRGKQCAGITRLGPRFPNSIGEELAAA